VRATLEEERAMLALLRKRIELPGRSKSWLVEAASFCVKKEDYELAAKVYTSLFEDDPRDPDVWAAVEGELARPESRERLAPLLERAVGLLRSAIQAAPDIGDATLPLARALDRAGRREDARRLYESILDRKPGDLDTARVVAERLEALGSTRVADAIELVLALDAASAGTLAPRLIELRDAAGDAEAVVRALALGVAADPGAPENRALFRRLVEAHRVAGDDAKALALLDGAVARHGGDEDLSWMRAQAFARAGDDEAALRDLASISADALVRERRADEARRIVNGLLARSPDHVSALEKSAALAAAERAWDRAAEAWGRLVGVLEQKGNADGAARAAAVVGLADATAQLGRPGDARDALERAVRRTPERDDLAVRLERACELAGDHARLAELLSARATRTHDGADKTELLLRAALETARMYVAAGSPAKALAPLRDAVERSKGRRSALIASVNLELGKAHLALDELLEALEALKAGFAMDLRSSETAMLLGLVAVDVGDEKTAERALLAVATLPPKRDGASGGAARAEKAEALYHLASMAHVKGDRVKARGWVVKALAEAPSHDRALALLEHVDAAQPAAVVRSR
jgi:tetratricopeptide (TPR) repeat protein